MDRRSQSRRGSTLERAPVPEPTSARPDEMLERHQRVHLALGGLTEAQQQLLMLKQVGDLTYGEIATMLGVAEGTIKSRLHAAVKAFRKGLAGEGQ